MKNLIKPIYPSEVTFTQIVEKMNNPDKGHLEGIRVDIQTKHQSYKTLYDNNTLEKIQNSNYIDPCKHHLKSCYTTSSDLVNKLKKSIREIQPRSLKATCQYCGFGIPKTIDHYLPKESYSEFSMLNINLIPCCSDCNRIKDEFWKTAQGRGIINFYTDTIPNEQFLFCNIIYDDDVPYSDFYLANPYFIDVRFYIIIEAHFSRLELFERLKDPSSSIISEIKVTISNNNKLSKDQIALELLNDQISLANEFGSNYPRAVICGALAVCDRFLEEVIAHH